MKQLDINCDVGEGVGNEAELMPFIQSCNIACGGHAGDEDTMKEVVQLANKYSVNIGAHPSYPDPVNFGRKTLKMNADDFLESIQNQVNALNEIVLDLGLEMNHIKPHGALYNDVARDKALAQLFLQAISSFKNQVKIVVPYNSEIEKSAIEEGFTIIYEGFADRNYNDDLSLVARSAKNSVITNFNEVLIHVLEMLKSEKVTTVSGKKVTIKADTFCVHSDTANAVEIVRKLREETLGDLNV